MTPHPKSKYVNPIPSDLDRNRLAKEIRIQSAEHSAGRPISVTVTNREETDYNDNYAASFTKGLAHDNTGVIQHPYDYCHFVDAINSSDPSRFDDLETAETRGIDYNGTVSGTANSWSGWASPRAGHVYDTQGPDAGAVAMSPAPRIGSSELAAEMGEVYAAALLRDVPFTEIALGGGTKLYPERGEALLSSQNIVDQLNDMKYFSGASPVSSTPNDVLTASGLNQFEENRRQARTRADSVFAPLTPNNLFRGSTEGAHRGPYISQFLLAGTNSLYNRTINSKKLSEFPGLSSRYRPADGLVNYGSQVIDQRVVTHKNGLDYMTTWASWLDVQNGASFAGADQFEGQRRFITTPRDLATYVHYDALYQTYLNACLMMLSMGVPTSTGFPEGRTGKRQAFATFGGPHILSLVAEVASRCLKAVRRQKFNYHRRARPELMGGRLTWVSLLNSGVKGADLGAATSQFAAMLGELPTALLGAVVEHNKEQNSSPMVDMRGIHSRDVFPGDCPESAFHHNNLLLPMAFPEGSPMHPSYGAGHATVAGGCVTMLKAFFEMFVGDSDEKRTLNSDGHYYVPNADGSQLDTVVVAPTNQPLTVQGELDKLAANIAIGRNMAGVHYYSDYYDSLRMGERVAVGILMDQSATYGEPVSMRFSSFDGDLVTVSGNAGMPPSLAITDGTGNPVSSEAWWSRHR